MTLTRWTASGKGPPDGREKGESGARQGEAGPGEKGPGERGSEPRLWMESVRLWPWVCCHGNQRGWSKVFMVSILQSRKANKVKVFVLFIKSKNII